jgi:succinate-semialdehyde dehydrogenase/glutarate-semialdehyde dehydrogenase
VLTLEVGKPITQARGEVELVTAIYQYYADNAARFLRDENLDIVRGGEAIVRTEPIGSLLGIMPWNIRTIKLRSSPPPISLWGTQSS